MSNTPLKTMTLAAFALVFMLFMAACGGGESHDHADHANHDQSEQVENTADTPAVHGENAAYTSAYVCPMHCEGSGSEEAGECPVCGMSYVAQADHTGDGHSH